MGEVRASQGPAARDGEAVIELRLKTLAQLYDSLDPSPFREKALDRNVESWLIECAEEHGPDQSLRLVVHAAPEVLPHAAAVADAVHTHFQLAVESAERRHRARLRIHRFAMLLGLVVLAVTLALRRLIGDLGGELAAVLGEGLLILGWVALWRPAEYLLFDTWEQRQSRRVLRQLARMPVELRPPESP
jgi:uncharacterized membrane protein YgdD (TMEM256/DUF423 family)